MEIINFFADENNNEVLCKFDEFLINIKQSDERNNFLSVLHRELIPIIGYLSERGNCIFLDKHCQKNIQEIGEIFISIIINAEQKKENIALFEKIFSFSFRFMCEVGFKDPENMQYIRSYDFSVNNLDKFTHCRGQIIYALYAQPAKLIQEMLQSQEISSFLDFKNIAAKAERIKSELNGPLDEKEKRVEILKAEFDKLSSGFNFVGLSQGFEQLTKQKNKEKTLIFWSLISLACLSLGVLGAEIYLIYEPSNKLITFPKLFLYAALPTLAIEVLLIYYFRVVLFNFKSIKTQLIQLELRQTLCQFIQNYAEYAKEIKTNDSVALEKFENLIFSGLVAHDENLPSTFDGFEQIAKLVNSIKSK